MAGRIYQFKPKFRMGKIKRLPSRQWGGAVEVAEEEGPPSENLGLRLKADAIVGINDGDAVATWEDSSSVNNDATQGTAANRPVYKVNIINGKPVVRFDATNDGMVTANAAFSANP